MKTLLLACTLLFSITVKGQIKLAEKYVDDGLNEITCIKFKPDLIFEYGYHVCTTNDDAVGRYKLNKDTIVLFACKTTIDTTSNSPWQIYPAPFKTYNIQGLRPDTLIIKGHKLYKFKNGHTINGYERFELNYTPARGAGYRRKYFLFGPYLSKQIERHYMVDAKYVKWKKLK
jgi:hypothetical protein